MSVTPQIKEWRELTIEYQPKYFAFTESPHPNPEHVRHAFSGGRYNGDHHRYWAFTTKSSFDHFCGVYQCVICLDPGGLES